MSENYVILVTSSNDHTFIFWDAKTEQQNLDINYGDKLIMYKIDTPQDKKCLVATGNCFASYYNVISQKKEAVYIYDGYNNNITGIEFFKGQQFLLQFF